jgi:hypothetical protein
METLSKERTTIIGFVRCQNRSDPLSLRRHGAPLNKESTIDANHGWPTVWPVSTTATTIAVAALRHIHVPMKRFSQQGPWYNLPSFLLLLPQGCCLVGRRTEFLLVGSHADDDEVRVDLAPLH